MTVRDILSVAEPAVEVYPYYGRGPTWLLCEKLYRVYNESNARESFQKNLEFRNKARLIADNIGIDSEGFPLISGGLKREVTVLNKNVTSYNDLLGMEVERVACAPSKRRHCCLLVYVTDIFVVQHSILH